MLIFVLSLVGISIVLAVAHGIERICNSVQTKSVPINAFAGFVYLVITQAFSALIAPAVFWMSGRIGKPPAHISGHGWTFILGVVATLAVFDFADYCFHRLEHKIPWFWAMHSFHHSDSTMNATTAYRNFWLDRVLQAVWMIPFGMIFRVDLGIMLCTIAAGWVIAAFQHLNIPLGLGRFSWLIITPQYHRIHHSTEQKHYDRNFAVLFPIWDVLFGTYLKPEGFPETGLREREAHSIKDALLWAFQRP